MQYHAGEADTPAGDVTQNLQDAAEGGRDLYDALFKQVYAELQGIAHSHLRNERSGHTLNTTALVHEAYVKLATQTRVHWQSRAHFYAVASQAMRRILINYAERRNAVKRGGGAEHIPLEEAELLFSTEQAQRMMALNDALSSLGEFNQRGAEVVTYRFFGGLTYDEIAEVMGTSAITVRRSWSTAKSWLRKELKGVGVSIDGLTYPLPNRSS